MARKQREIRLPRQRRSRLMVSRLLAAAAELFVERGYDGTTTNHIAERAEASIGSLYQFFPNKASMLAALQVEWTDRLIAELDAALTGSGGELPLDALLDQVLDIHVRLNQDPPGILGFLLTAPVGPDQAHVPPQDLIDSRVERLLSLRAVPMPDERRRTVALMIGHLISAIYQVEGPVGTDDTKLLAETKQALLAYLTPLELRRADPGSS
ncbi:TetR/AcrR family transcriptional regulator [Streptomyces sp. NPDC058867]|uniref:TetR/AcrR family transcriptional regulator n=1 Tax=unclassified Streptomyces TaxID=2593676 RepID=UPI0036A39170